MVSLQTLKRHSLLEWFLYFVIEKLNFFRLKITKGQRTFFLLNVHESGREGKGERVKETEK